MSKNTPAPDGGTTNVEKYEFEPIKGYPMLNWCGKRPFTSTQYYPAQLKEVNGEEVDGWRNKIFWGDNLQVMSHLLKEFRGKVDLIYIDPPFDSGADYRRKITIRGRSAASDYVSVEDKQYGDIWTNDEYLQFMYEQFVLLRELLSQTDRSMSTVTTEERTSCLAPHHNGIPHEGLEREKLWDKHCTAAPQRQRQFAGRYSGVKKA